MAGRADRLSVILNRTEAEKYHVYLNGIFQNDVLEAKAGDRGFVVRRVNGLNGQPLIDADGRTTTTTEWGKVEFREAKFDPR